MTLRGVLGAVLVLAGAFLNVPIAIALGVVTVGFEVVRQLSVRGGVSPIGYRRHLSSPHVPWGEEATLTIEIWNRSRLPMSWVRSDDEITEDAVVRERQLQPGELGDMTLRNTWTLGPRELVRRRLHVGASRRGVFEIGPTEIVTGDLFALPAARDTFEHIDRYTVWPRTVPAPAVARRERWGGVDRARHGLSEDPARFVGIRDYQPGDPVRRLHVRASARLGRPMSKRFEPSRDRDVLLVVDLEPPAGDEGRRHRPSDGPTEDIIVVAASLVRSLGHAHAAFGLAAAGYAGPQRRIAWLPVSSAPGQLERGLDLLARLGSGPSTSFERLIGFVGRVAREGTTVLALTGRDATPLLRPLRGLRRQGLVVGVLAAGAEGPASVRAARAAGVRAELVDLDGPWRTATRVVVAG